MTFLRAVTLLCVLAMTSSSQLFAVIYSANDPSFAFPNLGHFVTGTGNVTIDSESGLAWLDITLSTDLNHLDVVAQLAPGGYYDGYRLAHNTEVIDFWRHAGITVPNSAAIDDTAAMSPLMEMVGWLIYPVNPNVRVASVSTADQTLSPTLFDSLELRNNTAPGFTDRADDHPLFARAPEQELRLPFALVRDASSIPEPSSLVLAALGLLGGYGMLRVKRRRAFAGRAR